MQDLEQEIKELIIEVLNLEDMTPADIDSHAQLFGDDFGLDSIDALELGVAIKKKYNITIDADDANAKKYFESVSSLAKFVAEHRNREV